MLPCTAEALLYHWKASSVEHLGSMCLAQKHSERYFLGGGQSVFQSPPLCNMLRSAWLISSSNTPHICAATMTGVEQFTSHGSLCILLLRGHGSVQSVFYCSRQKHTCTSGLFSMCLCVWFVYVWFVCMCVCVCVSVKMNTYLICISTTVLVFLACWYLMLFWSRHCYHFFYDRIDLFVSGLYFTVFTLIFTTFTQKVTAL